MLSIRGFARFKVHAFFIAVLLLAGCAPAATPAATATVAASGPSALSVAVAATDFATGKPRVPFVLFVGSKPISDARSVTIAAFDLSSGTPVAGWSGQAVAYNDYDIPYWVAYPELPHAGAWGLGVVVNQADNTEATAQFTIEALADPSAPQIGEAAPPSHNRTLTTEPDLAKLTSDTAPEPALYQMTVADALKSGKVTVVTFATPAFCTSRLCAPVVNSVKAVYTAYSEKANFIHIEVYKTFNPLVYADEMAEWNLQGEPWTYIIGADGKVAALLGGPLSPRELEQSLKPLVAP
ncbi:MAG: hypothetical protein ABI847_18570 [Anaerolineales bacterium]